MKQTVKPVAKRRAGRGVAVLVPAVMEELSVSEGDHVRIEGEEGDVAVARVQSGSPNRDGVRIDRHLRRAVGADVGDTVTVTPADASPARSVTLALSTVEGSSERELAVRDELEGRALLSGQSLAVPVGSGSGRGTGTHTADAEHHVLMHVVATDPDGAVVVEEWTDVEFVTGDTVAGTDEGSDGADGTDGDGESGEASGTDDADAAGARDASWGADGPGTAATGEGPTPPGVGLTGTVTYDDVGGLEAELERIRETVELPLRHPDLFRRLGVDPPRGVLLYGPPGTGKTLIARAVANEADVHLETISGPTIASKYYGETEQRLREVFERARENEPAIVFVDELDSLAGKRSETTGDVESRVVAQLLSLLDGLEDGRRTVVVGTTNRVDAIDPALRRPGRFDREIEIGVPDVADREEILRIHSRDIPLADDVDLGAYAEKTHGFVGADLENLVRESVMRTLRRVRPLDADTPVEGRPVDGETLADVEVTAADVEAAMRQTEPSALREVFVEVPDVSWADVGGLAEAKARLRETVQWPLAYPEAFERVDLHPATGVLLYGPPGTGKTLLAKAVANEAESNFISVKGPELLDKYVGESEKGVREVFAKARENAPTVVFFDEIDAIAGERGSTAGAGVSERVVSQLLTELDGLEELEDVVVVATTNRPELLDDALTRPGRFDRHVEVAAPDEDGRREIFAVHTAAKPLADDVDLGALARETDGYVGADIEAVCREAAAAAVREFVDDGGANPDTIVLTAAHFERALEEVTPGERDDDRVTDGGRDRRPGPTWGRNRRPGQTGGRDDGPG